MNATNHKTIAALERATIRASEISNGFRASDPFVIATMLAHHFGFRILPIIPRKKCPCLEDWPRNASSEFTTIFDWRMQGRDFSILTGKAGGVVVLDVDAPRDFVRAVEKYGPLPATVKVETGRSGGGFHLWFRADPAREELRTTSKVLGGAIDVRGWHGQSVIPGSLHRSGARYRFADGCAPDEIGIADLPQKWFEALPKWQDGASREPAARTRMRSAPRNKIEHAKTNLIGDGEWRGGFHRPIYATAIQYFLRCGCDASEEKLIARLWQIVQAAPRHPDRDISRYRPSESGNDDLTRQVRRARGWVQSNA